MKTKKRERENPCGVCGHYHKYEEGEVCGICGHRVPAQTEKLGHHLSAFPSEILPQFLYLGTYDHASRIELLKAQGISHILNTVPTCQNLYKNAFTYYCFEEANALPFDEAVQFLGQCEMDKARVLVHCMTGKSRSSAVVIAYLMKCKGWRLAQSYQWVKERRPSIDLTPAVNQELQEYEQKIFGAVENSSTPAPAFGFGFQKTDESDTNPVPAFCNLSTNSIFENAAIPPQDFAFGAASSSNPSNNGQMES